MPPARLSVWSVYLLRCADGTLYAGSTTDVEARTRAHNAGRGARYTSGRRPVEVVYQEACGSRSAALRREHALKRLTRPEKDALIRRS
jgi:putative endonuclease